MLPQMIPPSHIFDRTSMSLLELKWAFDVGLIGAQTVVDVAAALVGQGAESDMIVELAGTLHEELPKVKEILGPLAVHPASSDELRRKWVWLVLSWVYEHRNECDIFEAIERLYADLGYPPEMIPFGPYAPAYQIKRDPQEARKEVLAELRTYLKRGREEFGKASQL